MLLVNGGLRSLLELLVAPIIVTVASTLLAGALARLVAKKNWGVVFPICAVVLAIGVIITLVIGSTTLAKVPDLNNLSQDQAELKLKNVGLKFEFTTRYDENVDKRIVIPDTQDPKAGIFVKKGFTVEAVVSKGPLPKVPDVIGKSKAEGEEIIKAAGLKPQFTEAYNDKVPKNIIISQDPEAETIVKPGSKVNVVVSKGAVSIEITSPQEGELVSLEYTVEGTSFGLKSEEIYILLHPHPTEVWWVQNPPTIQSDGSWQVLCYFGTEDQGIGDSYDVCAIVTTESLQAGQMLTILPPRIASDSLTVKRVQ